MAIEAPSLVLAKLIPFAYSIISVAMGGDATHHDQGVVDLSAQHPHEITELGRYPVAELTPDEKAHDLTAVEKSFGYDKDHHLKEGINDYDTDTTNDSDALITARAALVAEGLSGDELEQAMAQVRDHIKDFIAASHHDTIGDPSHPFSQNGVTDVYIKDGKMIMGDGSHSAKEVTLNLSEPEEASQLLVTTTDAQGVQHSHTVTIFDKCANPAVQDVLPEPVVPAPAPVDPCEHGWQPKHIHSDKGIDIDGACGPIAPQQDIVVQEAPSHMDVNQALEDLQKQISDGKISIPDDGKPHKFLLWVDEDCDGIPENIECVTVVSEGHRVTIKVEEFQAITDNGTGPYDALSRKDKEDWIKKP